MASNLLFRSLALGVFLEMTRKCGTWHAAKATSTSRFCLYVSSLASSATYVCSGLLSLGP